MMLITEKDNTKKCENNSEFIHLLEKVNEKLRKAKIYIEQKT
jgi:hypothetical protein